MIDWEGNNCEIINTARNGKQALELIETEQPDIVFADLNMPVMDGLELLQQVKEKYPHIVFLILTNLEEFSSAQKALQLNAIDYIVKSSLEPAILENALVRAKNEALKRKSLERVEIADRYINKSQDTIVKNALIELLDKNSNHSASIEWLEQNGFLEQFAIICLPFKPNEVADTTNYDDLFKWEFDLVEKLAKNFFKNTIVFKANLFSSLYIFTWNVASSENHMQNIDDFFGRLENASTNITALTPYIYATAIYNGYEQFIDIKKELFEKSTYSYLFSEKSVIGVTEKLPELVPIPVTSFSNRLLQHLNSHNKISCYDLLSRVKTQIETTAHEKSQAIWLCTEIHLVLQSSGFFNQLLLENQEKLSAQNYYLARFINKEQVIFYLETVMDLIGKNTSFFSAAKPDLIEKAKQYAKNNINKKASLQDVARHIGMSTSYFSSFFKQETGQNFVDYANALKIIKAKELLESQKYRMNEIAYMLGFENAYYFSKVFRKYTGTTPTKYQQERIKE